MQFWPRFVVVVAFIASGCAPHDMSRELVTVTGEFLPGEQCAVHTPRGALADSVGAGRTFYEFGGAHNVAPPGYVVHTIWCRIVTPIDSVGLDGRRWLQISIPVRDGQSIPTGRFAITDAGVFDTATFTASVSVAHPGYDLGTPGSGTGGEGGHISLDGVSGELPLTRVDPPSGPEAGLTSVPRPQILGRFTMRARRNWSM
jgi:hypothetical protein